MKSIILQYDEKKLRLGKQLEKANYFVQSKEEHKNSDIFIDNIRCKFEFKSIMIALCIDNTITENFENGKFKNFNVIKNLRQYTERQYEKDENNPIFDDSYKEAIQFKKDVCCIYRGSFHSPKVGSVCSSC